MISSCFDMLLFVIVLFIGVSLGITVIGGALGALIGMAAGIACMAKIWGEDR